MLNLKCETPQRWIDQVADHLDEILIDHAHCEKKAAGCAMSLLVSYIEHDELCREMTTIVNEELEHFQMVKDILADRGIPFRRLKPGDYGKNLTALTRPNEPDRAVDRLLIAGLIEARSCERFDLLRQHAPDAELADFYGSLFESEARHHTVYVKLAKTFADPKLVQRRLEELATEEAGIVLAGDPKPRMHS